MNRPDISRFSWLVIILSCANLETKPQPPPFFPLQAVCQRIGVGETFAALLNFSAAASEPS